MKFLAIILLTAVLQVSATGRAQTVTYSGHDVPLKLVLTAIEKQTGYVFFYDPADVAQVQPLTLEVRKASLVAVLDAVLGSRMLGYDIQGNTIMVMKKEVREKPQEVGAAPLPAVHGRIVNEDGEPVAATIIVKGTHQGTATNAKGEFELRKVEGNATLVISGVSFESFDIKLNGKGELGTLTVKKKAGNMQEIVVNKGYYSTKQMYNTGDVTTVSGDDIRKAPVTDPILGLEGRVPGLSISQTSGIPGASYTIRLRGQNSISNGNNPLYIIDGVPFNPNSLTTADFSGAAIGSGPGTGTYLSTGGLSPFNTLNPNNIESIEVLKDADATAIYGSQGANGVVLITTRKGKAGQTKIDADVSTSTSKVAHELALLSREQYLTMRREAFKNDGVLPGPTDYDVNGAWDTTRYTDWQKILIGNTSHLSRANLSLSGGSANTTFLLDGGYSFQNTVFPGNYHDKVTSINLVVNHSSENRKFSTQINAQYAENSNVVPMVDFTSLIRRLSPIAPPLYDDQGHVNYEDGAFSSNPMGQTLESATSVDDNLTSNLRLAYELLPGLRIQADLGISRMSMTQSNLTPAAAYYGPPNAQSRQNESVNTSRNTWNVNPQASYTRDFGKGHLNIVAGGTLQRNVFSTLAVIAEGFSSDDLIGNIANASTILIYGNEYTDYRHSHLYAAINYIQNDKYVLNLTGSRDGSSRFGPANPFANFGGVGVAWLFSRERAITRALPFLSFGKLRASYGTTGNDQITDYQYLSLYHTYNSYQGTIGLQPVGLANPNFAWEVVNKLELGTELGFVHDRMNLNVSWYRNRTNNQLVGQTLPAQDGFITIQANLPAVVQNSGLEATLNTTNIKSRKFNWTTSFNISFQRNKLVSFPGLAYNPSYSSYYTVGKPIFSTRTYHYMGVDPQTGLYTIQDVDQNGSLTSSDRELDKYIAQDYYGGFLNTFSYKGWQLDVFFNFVKQTGKSYINNFSLPGAIGENQPVYVMQRWQKPGDRTDIAKFTTGAGTGAKATTAYYNTTSSDRYITDASYIRLKNVALSYSLPAGALHRVGMQTVRVYINAQNLLSLTKFQGFDPETQGISLPPLRTIAIGLRASF